MKTKVDLAPFALKVGDLAYYDTTFSGLVPCKVLGFRQATEEIGQPWYAQIKLTASRKAYRSGETMYVKASDVPPRTCVYRRDWQYRVRDSWHVEHEGERHDVFASADNEQP